METSGVWSSTLLNLMKRLNNFNFPEACKVHKCVPLFLGTKQLGIVLPEFIEQLVSYTNVFQVQSYENSQNEKGIKSFHFNSQLSTIEERDKAVGGMLDELRAKDLFAALRGWRNEKFSVYYERHKEPLVHVERSACPLFGFLMYGIHVNGYTYKDDKLMMWIGRRSATKPTHPGMLDNMCAGGLTAGLGIRECAIKECQEEASVDDKTLESIKSVGTVSYCYQDKRGILPETQFVFDLELSNDFVPCNADGEVDSFYLYSIKQIQELIIEGKFKPNCALVIVHFLIRHGFLTPDNEPYFAYLEEKMHVSLQPNMGQ